MKEIEIKILDIDTATIKKKLDAIGATLTTERRAVEAWLLDTHENEIQEKNQVLRVRKNGENIEVTFKGARNENSDFKICDEFTMSVSSVDAALAIFENIGYTTTLHHKKYRTTYTLHTALIEIEEAPGIPPYIEIEGTEDAIRHTVTDLGYTWEQTTSIGGVEIYTMYGKDIRDFQILNTENT